MREQVKNKSARIYLTWQCHAMLPALLRHVPVTTIITGSGWGAYCFLHLTPAASNNVLIISSGLIMMVVMVMVMVMMVIMMMMMRRRRSDLNQPLPLAINSSACVCEPCKTKKSVDNNLSTPLKCCSHSHSNHGGALKLKNQCIKTYLPP